MTNLSPEHDDGINDGLRAAVDSSAQDLDGREKVVERDLEVALERALINAGISVGKQRTVDLKSWVGRLGPVDLTIDGAMRPTLLELKWSSADLEACAWDVAKLSTALAEGAGASAYLVAGAPADVWATAAPGVELFDSRPWRAEGLFSAYARGFAFWREDVANYPRSIQREWRMRAEGPGAKLSVGGVAYEIRAVEVVVGEPALERVDYTPTLRPRKMSAGALVDSIKTPAVDDAEEAVVALEQTDISQVVGDSKKVPGGEGFSLAIATPHFLLTDESAMRHFGQEERDMLERPLKLRRFESGAARRSWLTRRTPLAEPWPELLELSSGSGFPERSLLAADGRSLDYRFDGFAEPVERRIRPNDHQWVEFWRELDRIGVWDWGPFYQPEEFGTDGFGWHISIAKAGRTAQSRGYLAFPCSGETSLDPSPEWSECLMAFRRLIGGLPLAMP